MRLENTLIKLWIHIPETAPPTHTPTLIFTVSFTGEPLRTSMESSSDISSYKTPTFPQGDGRIMKSFGTTRFFLSALL